MGKYNSSTYRIKPLMKEIENNPELFEKFLNVMKIEGLSNPDEYHYADQDTDKTEKALKPTKNHLSGLVKYLSGKGANNYSSTSENRIRLFNGKAEKRDLALSEIEKNYDNLPSRAWYIFEGYTYPDIYIEGKDYVIICEGKWTEPHITTETTYLNDKNGGCRNQMVRHIQGALNSTDKKVFAFYIVDKECGYLDELTKAAFEKHVEKETISLSYSEKYDVISSYYGYTTWQDISEVLGINFKSKEEVDNMDS